MAVVACSRAARLDLSTDESFASSLAKVNASLAPEEQARFSDALSLVMRHALGGGMREAAGVPGARARLEEALSGKTAAQVMAAADALAEADNAAE